MPPIFVPRQRKHKVLARLKDRNSTDKIPTDSNTAEYVAPSKTEILEKKRLIKENLLKDGSKISGKKAKRLEKYLETKLRKDENRELILQLAKIKSDTSLYHSSRRLGQGKETNRQRLERALKDRKAGINIDRDDEDILKSHTSARTEAGDFLDSFDAENVSHKVKSPALAVNNLSSSLGSGLKRPLEVSEDGRPVLKKKQRRGGIKSKFSTQHKGSKFEDDSEWDGFSSDSNFSTSPVHDWNNQPCELQKLPDDSHQQDNSDTESQTSSDKDDESLESFSEIESTPRKERSTAFKTWASQQINEALGFEPTSNISMGTCVSKITDYRPRSSEQDPLPLELQSTKNTTRKSYYISVTRPENIQQMRLQLPVVAEEQKIMEAIHNNSVTVIYGTTGSGKTTQIPQFLFEAGYGSSQSEISGMIGVTQPRRVAAVSMSKRIGDEIGEHREKVAYQIRFEGTVSSKTAIKFMTDGVLLREAAKDISLRKYSAIIIDEAHERSVNTDILIGMLSQIVKLREGLASENFNINPLKLIIMSATLDIKDFAENTNLFSPSPPVLKVEGRQYPVTCHFARRTSHNYIDEAFKKISKGHQKLPPGGFLVFLTSRNEISRLGKQLKEAFGNKESTSSPQVRISGKELPLETEDIDFGDINTDDDRFDNDDDDDDDSNIDFVDDFNIGEEATGPTKMHILPLYSLLSTKEQLRIFEPPPAGSRLVILATNVAETSLTIPNIRYVFDCGRSKERKYDRITGVQSFEIGWISKASAQQRAGRAGRTCPGHCYRLFSSAIYERDFPEFSEPEILRTPIDGVVLQLKAMNLENVINFPFPTPPESLELERSEKLLRYLSALSPTGKITEMGISMSVFPLSPRFSRILLVGHLHKCLPYTIALVAGLSVPELFIHESKAMPSKYYNGIKNYPQDSERNEDNYHIKIIQKYNKVHKRFCFLDEKSDAIKLLQVVGEFAHEPTEAWCQDHFVRFKTLKEISLLRRQISELLRINIDAFSAFKYEEKLNRPSEKQIKMLKQIVATGFIDHVAIRADMSPNPPEIRRKITHAIDMPYFTLFPSSQSRSEDDQAVYIHPESPMAHLSPQECPKYIIYSHLQRMTPAEVGSQKISKTRMHSLTDITGNQLAALTKGTPLLHYGKPFKEVLTGTKNHEYPNTKECWVIPYLRAEGVGGTGWPLPARKVTQKKIPGQGWVIE